MARIEEILLRISAEDSADEALSNIERRLDELDRKRATAEVKVDDRQALAAIHDIRDQLARLAHDRADPSVHLSDAAAKAELDSLQHRLDALGHDRANPQVRLEDAAARAELDAFRAKLDEATRDRTVHIKVDADQSALDRVKQDMAGIGERARQIPRYLIPSIPVLGSIVGFLGRATLGAGALAIAAGGAGAAFGLLGYAMVDAAKHGSGATKKAADEMKAAWTSVKSTIERALAPAMIDVAKGATSMLNSMKPAVAGLKSAYMVLGSAIRNALDDPAVQGAVQQLIADFGEMVRATAPLVGPLLQGIIQLADTFVRIATAAMPQLVRYTQEFANYLAGLNGPGSTLSATIQRWIGDFRQVLSAVIQVVHNLAPLFAGGPFGAGLLSILQLMSLLIGDFARLLNAAGPVGKLFGAGLGIALLIVRFKGLFSLIAAGPALFMGLVGVIKGLGAALAALIGGRGIGGAISAYKGMTGATKAAEAAEKALIPTKQKEQTAASAAAKEDTALATATSKIAPAVTRATGAIRRLGPALAVGVTAAAVTAAVAAHRAGTRIGSGIVQGVRSALPQVRNAARAVFGSVAQSAQSAIPRVRGDTSHLMQAVHSTIAQARGSISSIARNVFGTIPAAAQHTHPPTVSTTHLVMNAARNVVATARGAIHTVATNTFGMIPQAAKGASPAAFQAVHQMMQHSTQAVTDQRQPVQSASKSVWQTIVTTLGAVGGGVVGILKTIQSKATGSLQAMDGPIGAAAKSGMEDPVVKTVEELMAELVTRSLFPEMMQKIVAVIAAASGAAASAMRTVTTAILGVVTSAQSAFTSAGQSLMRSLASGITAGTSWVVTAVQAAAAAAKAVLPHSEPSDPRSPLRNLKASGEAIIANVVSGITAGPFQQAMRAALKMPVLPDARLNATTMPYARNGDSTADRTGADVRVIVNVNALHPGDPRTHREISQAVTEAIRRSYGANVPARA